MSINIYNAERYFDPTPFEALCLIEAEAKKKVFRPLVFICSPYAGDTERNIENARRYCRFAVSKHAIPFAPHLLFPQFMEDDDKEQRNLGLLFGMVFMCKCLEMWVFGKNITKGMSVEIEKAQQRGLKLRYFTDRCEEVPENERA